MKVLTELQERVLHLLFDIEEIRRHFYLTGGTALSAFYLEHRSSDDLDLFTHDAAIAEAARIVEDAVRGAGFSIESTRASPTFRSFAIEDSLRLDLVRDVEARVGAPTPFGRIMVDAKKNIAVNKVLAIYGRLDPKDYVDLFFLLRDGEFDIMDLIRFGQRKDAGLEPFQWAKVIADAESLSILPRMIVPCDLAEIRAFFRRLREEVIDSIQPKR